MEKRAANRQRLLDAARRVFAERGYHAATIEAIAHESGLSNGAVYYNFAGKEDLFLALFDQEVEQRIESLERVFGSGQATDESTEVEVRTAAHEAAQAVEDPRDWALFFEFAAYAGRDPDFRRQFQKRMRAVRKVLARVVEVRSEALGVTLTVPPDQAAIGMQGLSWGLAVHRVADPGAAPPELFAQLVVAMLRGLAAGGD